METNYIHKIIQVIIDCFPRDIASFHSLFSVCFLDYEFQKLIEKYLWKIWNDFLKIISNDDESLVLF